MVHYYNLAKVDNCQKRSVEFSFFAKIKPTKQVQAKFSKLYHSMVVNSFLSKSQDINSSYSTLKSIYGITKIITKAFQLNMLISISIIST